MPKMSRRSFLGAAAAAPVAAQQAVKTVGGSLSSGVAGNVAAYRHARITAEVSDGVDPPSLTQRLDWLAADQADPFRFSPAERPSSVAIESLKSVSPAYKARMQLVDHLRHQEDRDLLSLAREFAPGLHKAEVTKKRASLVRRFVKRFGLQVPETEN